LILLDASALLGFMLGEPSRSEVEQLLRGGEAALTSTTLAEVVDRLTRRRRIPMEAVRERLGPLTQESLSVIAIDEAVGWRAGEIRATHYSRSSSDLAMADCIQLACASPDDVIATSDRALAQAGAAEGLRVIPLPASDGTRPPAPAAEPPSGGEDEGRG
jgi:PIN domain nuclease of toxin-antitoxin system